MAKKVLSRAENVNAELNKLLTRDEKGNVIGTIKVARPPDTSLVMMTMTLLATLESENDVLRDIAKTHTKNLEALRATTAEQQTIIGTLRDMLMRQANRPE